MPLISQLSPYNDPGSLQGGIRSRIAEIFGIQADVFRSAAQDQSVGQSGRAFSGAQVTNEMTQAEVLNQTANSENTKNVTIADANPTVVPSGFNYNYLEQALTQIDAGNFLSRSILNLSQRQHADQDGFAKGTDFQGNPSVVTNTLTETTETNQTATSRVNNNIVAKRDPDVENAARFRETVVDLRDILTEVGTTASQDQGSPEDMSVQNGRADGGVVNNNLNQTTTGTQTNNSFMQNTIDVSEEGVNNTLTPRSATVLVHIENDVVRNYGSASQTQGLLQIAEGGVDEFGNPTENGGQVHNVSNLSASFTDNSVVANTTSILA